MIDDSPWHEIRVEAGVDLGAPLSNIVFPAAIHSALVTSEAKLREQDPQARVLAFQDGIVLMCSPRCFQTAVQRLTELLCALGLKLAPKSTWWAPERLAAGIALDGNTRTMEPAIFKQGNFHDPRIESIAVHADVSDPSAPNPLTKINDAESLLTRRHASVPPQA
jgi:hypothetical protein